MKLKVIGSIGAFPFPKTEGPCADCEKGKKANSSIAEAAVPLFLSHQTE